MQPSGGDVAVVGAGVMGLATTRALARSGAAVTLYEQFRIGHAGGSSHGSSRIFRLSYPDERWVRDAQLALPLWRELEEESGETLLEVVGTLDLGAPAANVEALRAAGVLSEVLTPAELEARWPLAAEGRPGLYQPDGGFLHADRTLRALRASAEAADARIVEGERVEPGELGAAVVVVTAGAWAPQLVELDVTPTIETVSYAEWAGPPVPSLIDWGSGGDAPHYSLLAPGIGIKGGSHHGGRPAAADEEGTPDPALVEEIDAWLERRFIGAQARPERAETCRYTNTADEEFVLEARGRTIVGSPCSGHGFKFAPLVGERLAALARDAL